MLVLLKVLGLPSSETYSLHSFVVFSMGAISLSLFSIWAQMLLSLCTSMRMEHQVYRGSPTWKTSWLLFIHEVILLITVRYFCAALLLSVSWGPSCQLPDTISQPQVAWCSKLCSKVGIPQQWSPSTMERGLFWLSWSFPSLVPEK